MLSERLPRIFGGRIFKTAFAAFVTAYVCEWLGWPPLFAVMTAIVSIEPTSRDSIRKGLVRLPASVIGAGFAMLFEAMFHHSALTYTLASVFTLYTCHKLKLHDGIVVATLTSVAMVTITHDHYLDSFIVRMGTTLTGLIVASLINFFVFPPKYAPMIRNSVISLYNDTGDFLATFLYDITKSQLKYKQEYDLLCKKLERTFKLIHFQRSEWVYHKYPMDTVRDLKMYQKKLEYLQKVMYHIGNLLYQDVPDGVFSKEERILLRETGQSLAVLYHNIDQPISNDHYENIDQLNQLFCEVRESAALFVEEEQYHHHFSPKLIIMYELLSLHDVIEELQEVTSRYSNHMKQRKGYNDKKTETKV